MFVPLLDGDHLAAALAVVPLAGASPLGIAVPTAWRWFWLGPLVAVGVLAILVASAWLAFDSDDANWFVRHAEALRELVARVPGRIATAALFWDREPERLVVDRGRRA